jgi:thymidylate synthase ThyX
MAFKCEVLADSISDTQQYHRLTTMELTYPRIIHSEVLTHRRFSRNSASSRAIPVDKMLRMVEDEPFIPIHWGAAQSGMQASHEVDMDIRARAGARWLIARDNAVIAARKLHNMGLHKQVINRIVEPFMWITVIVSGTESAWANFFALRIHQMAEPHIKQIACMAKAAYLKSEPKVLQYQDWHLPLFGMPGDEEVKREDRPKVSAARCARVSYLTHDGRRDVEEDLKLFHRLKDEKPMHASALEHPAMVAPTIQGENGNYQPGWVQFRKMFRNEAVDRMSDV